MKQKKDIIFITLFLIVIGLCLGYLFQTSYSKYKRQIEGNLSTVIAKWNIKVNNELINNKSTLNNYLVPVLDTNQYVKEGVLAPGGTGYFDIVINAEDVDVDFTYEITGEINEDTPLSDLIITGYEQDGVQHTFSGTSITGNINKNTGDHIVRVYFKWNDDTTNIMNNQEDTSYATEKEDQNAMILVSIHFIQKRS